MELSTGIIPVKKNYYLAGLSSFSGDFILNTIA